MKSVWMRLKRLWPWAEGTALVVLPVLALIVTLAPVVGLFDIARQLWPLTLSAALMASFVLALRHRFANMVLAFGAIILIALPVLPSWRSVPASLPSTDEDFELHLATHNVWGRYLDAPRVQAVLGASAADIIGLQEAWHADDLLTGEFGSRYPHRTNCSHATRIIATRPILASGCIEHPPETDWQNTPECQLDLPTAVWARFADDAGEPFHVVAVHMDWPTPFGVQDCERANFAGLLRQFPQDRLIVMGDFNAADPSTAMARMDRDLALTRQTYGMATWPAAGRFHGLALIPPPLIGIDHVFTGDDWQLIDRTRLADTGSDHRPITVRLRLTD